MIPASRFLVGHVATNMRTCIITVRQTGKPAFTVATVVVGESC